MTWYGVEAAEWTDTYYHWLMNVPEEFVTNYNTFDTSDGGCVYTAVDTDDTPAPPLNDDDDTTDDVNPDSSDSKSKNYLSGGTLIGIIIGKKIYDMMV
jgi:hypothetical protein